MTASHGLWALEEGAAGDPVRHAPAGHATDGCSLASFTSVDPHLDLQSEIPEYNECSTITDTVSQMLQRAQLEARPRRMKTAQEILANPVRQRKGTLVWGPASSPQAFVTMREHLPASHAHLRHAHHQMTERRLAALGTGLETKSHEEQITLQVSDWVTLCMQTTHRGRCCNPAVTCYGWMKYFYMPIPLYGCMQSMEERIETAYATYSWVSNESDCNEALCMPQRALAGMNSLHMLDCE